MISISTLTYDLYGVATFDPDPDSDLMSNVRRISRTATLDGGCVLTDQGFSDADRTLDIRMKQVPEALAQRLWYLFRNYSLLRVSTSEGCFDGAISNVQVKEGNLTMKFLVKERIA